MTKLQKILKGTNSCRSKFKILKGTNSSGEQILSLQDRKTAILNSQNITMLQTNVNNYIFNKYCLIHTNSSKVFEACYSTKLLSFHFNFPLDVMSALCDQLGLVSTDLNLIPCAGFVETF